MLVTISNKEILFLLLGYLRVKRFKKKRNKLMKVKETQNQICCNGEWSLNSDQ